MRLVVIIVAILLNVGQVSTAQNTSFYGLLPTISLTGKINNKLSYNFFSSTTINAFNRNINGEFYPASILKLYLQPSIIYIHSPNLNLAASYTFERSNPFKYIRISEHRLWQQIIFSNTLFDGTLINRFRLEERFIQNRINGNFPLSTRLRYQLGFKKPLKGKKINKGEFYFNSFNEIYLSFTGNKNAFLSNNYTYMGIGYKTHHSQKLEVGYQLQLSVRNKQGDFQLLNLVQVSFSANLMKHSKKSH